MTGHCWVSCCTEGKGVFMVTRPTRTGKNRTKSSVRAKVEHPFYVIKRVFGFCQSPIPRLGEEHRTPVGDVRACQSVRRPAPVLTCLTGEVCPRCACRPYNRANAGARSVHTRQTFRDESMLNPGDGAPLLLAHAGLFRGSLDQAVPAARDCWPALRAACRSSDLPPRAPLHQRQLCEGEPVPGRPVDRSRVRAQRGGSRQQSAVARNQLFCRG